MDCHEFFKDLGDAEIYRNEHSPDAGVLRIPERVKKEYILDEDEGSGEEGEEDDTEQGGLSDF